MLAGDGKGDGSRRASFAELIPAAGGAFDYQLRFMRLAAHSGDVGCGSKATF